MAAIIDVDEQVAGEYRVTVSEGQSATSHVVTVDEAYARKLHGGNISTVELVRRSFEFLLERESKEPENAINCHADEKYFHDFRRLQSSPPPIA